MGWGAQTFDACGTVQQHALQHLTVLKQVGVAVPEAGDSMRGKVQVPAHIRRLNAGRGLEYGAKRAIRVHGETSNSILAVQSVVVVERGD